MIWESLDGRAKEYFEYYRKLYWIQEHHLDALARGCLAAERLDQIESEGYELTRHDKYGDTQRSTPEAMEVRKLKSEVELMNKTFGLTPYDEAKITKQVQKPSPKTKRKSGRPLSEGPPLRKLN